MTNKEYFCKLMDELFDASNKTVEELVQDKRYREFEDDVEEIIRKHFKLLGCDTTNGHPTWLGRSLWLEANVQNETKEFIEQKYKIVQ